MAYHGDTMSAHLQLTGGWAECPAPSVCTLLFHVDMSVEAVTALPQQLVYPLLEAVQPPDEVSWLPGDPALAISYWRNEHGATHRDYDLPAVMTNEGGQFWYQAGNYHRDGDKPAIIWADGKQEWYQYGECHRDNGLPAVVDPDGTRIWFRDGLMHRDGGLPAFETPHGTRLWYEYGDLHRERGPAMIKPDGTVEYWYRGEKQDVPVLT